MQSSVGIRTSLVSAVANNGITCPRCGCVPMPDSQGRTGFVKGYCRRCYNREYVQSWNQDSDAKARKAIRDKRWYSSGGLKKILESRRRRRIRERLEVVAAYGGVCECCGEDNPMFLTVEHVGGRGDSDRQTCGKPLGGTSLYSKLRKMGYPKVGYSLLCFNCNIASGQYGVCPHKVVGNLEWNLDYYTASKSGLQKSDGYIPGMDTLLGEQSVANLSNMPNCHFVGTD